MSWRRLRIVATLAPSLPRYAALSGSTLLKSGQVIATFDEAVAYKHSTRLELADRILDDLQVAVDASENATAHRAMETLYAWDRQTEVGSRGAPDAGIGCASDLQIGEHSYLLVGVAQALLEVVQAVLATRL